MAHRKMVYRYGPGGDKYTEYEFKFVGAIQEPRERREVRERKPRRSRSENKISGTRRRRCSG